LSENSVGLVSRQNRCRINGDELIYGLYSCIHQSSRVSRALAQDLTFRYCLRPSVDCASYLLIRRSLSLWKAQKVYTSSLPLRCLLMQAFNRAQTLVPHSYAATRKNLWSLTVEAETMSGKNRYSKVQSGVKSHGRFPIFS